MSSARNKLILLGLICQGLTWDDYLLPFGNILIWVLCLTLLHGRLRLTVGLECLLMIGGAAAGLLLGRVFGHDTHYFIGHGLTVMQAVRLTRSLDRREKLFSILMACFQLGVGCTFLFDLRFILIFLGMVSLLPASFMELEAETFASPGLPPKSSVGARFIAAIFGFAVLFFLVFPRGSFVGAIPSLRGGSSDSTALLDALVDLTRSGGPQSRRVLMQIQGEKMGYLRSYSLGDFDGVRWTDVPFRRAWPIETASPEVQARSLSRRVNVKQVSSLGRVLPTDGHVVRLNGRFFRNPLRNEQDAIQCDAMRNTANNIYEYWIDPQPAAQPLSPAVHRRMTASPPQSARLRAWLDDVVAGEADPQIIARRLVIALQRNFKYTLGAPALNRLDPVDDFVFNQKQGHCERFASTLALLLRMKDIPSRVVIGYLPHRRGGLDGWYSVRFNDAHAWTEAYFEHSGWATLDATPAANLSDSGLSLRDWWDMLDLAWNLHVVNFDGASQRYLLSGSLKAASSFIAWTRANPLLPAGLAGALALAAAWRGFRSKGKKPGGAATPQQESKIMVGHYYGQMLRALAKQGFHRRDHQTPLEFLAQLASHARPWLAEAQFITRTFCETRYGHQITSPGVQSEIEQALERISKSRNPPG